MAVMLVALTSGLFVAGGVFRLSRWHITRDRANALLGTAQLLLGGFGLPWALMTEALSFGGWLDGLTVRAIASIASMILVVQACKTCLRNPARGGLVLNAEFGALPLAGVASLVLIQLALAQGPGAVNITLSLHVLVACGWFSVALLVSQHLRDVPWSRRAWPLFLALGVAELLGAVDSRHLGATTSLALLVALTVAVFTMRSALLDLRTAISMGDEEADYLAYAFQRASRQAGQLNEWREQLSHDARSTVAGLRAAIAVLEQYATRIDPGATGSLGQTAVAEIEQLEHLLTRTPELPRVEFDVSQVARAVVEAAQVLGQEAELHAAPTLACGRPGDLAVALKNVLDNARHHAPGSPVQVGVDSDADGVRITCSDLGQGVSADVAARIFDRGYRGAASTGTGLGLYSARALMQEQGGDLSFLPGDRGATFVLRLPAAAAGAAPGGLRLADASITKQPEHAA